MSRFWKGNTHTHTERSLDSKEPVSAVLQWYRDAGYNFLVLTDHDRSSVPGEFAALETSDFIAIAGEEVSSGAIIQSGEMVPIHVGSICSNGSTIGGIALSGVDNTLVDAVTRVADIADAIPQVNHPNWHRALPADSILLAQAASLMEVANQNSIVDNNGGDGEYPSVEEKWDEVLSRGMVIYGVASDDTHSLSPTAGTAPGRGWVQVSAQALSNVAICDALKSGEFYASTGVELLDVTVSESELRIEMVANANDPTGDYSTTFIGPNGVALHTVVGTTATYDLSQYEGYTPEPVKLPPDGQQQHYVRAVVQDANGKKAWVQPELISCRP